MTTTEAEPRAADTEHEGWATGWVTIGLVLGPLGATIGGYLVLRSTRWSARWKAAALAVSRSEGIESVAGLSRHCTGPSEAGSSVRLSNR